jgi:TolB-like protein
LRYLFDTFSLDTDRRELRRQDDLLAIEPKAFDLLVYLIANRERVVSKDDLVATIWGGRSVSETALTTCLNAVRRAIGDSGKAQQRIRTLPRKGVRFVGDVRQHDDPEGTGRGELSQDALRPALALPDKPSIAVLPFLNLSGDPEQDYFADGMVEEITTLLSRQRWLFVIARTSAFTYKGKMVDLKQVGRELGVRYLLEGSVRKAGNRVRVAAQLIDARSGANLWADNFDGKIDDIFELHDRIAVEVSGAVEPNLRNAEIDRSLRKPTPNLDAYDLYLRASTVFRDPTPDNLWTALELTQRALERDANFARVLALRSNCIFHLAEKFGPDAASEALRLAHAALAVSSDDSEATASAALTIAMMGGSIDTALWASQQALLINPSGFSALMHGGWVHCAAGNPEAAIELFSRALRLSPRDPLRGFCELGLANAYRDLRHPEDALVWARRAMLSLPRLAGGYRVAAAALVDLGRIDEAKELIAQLLRILPQSRINAALLRRQNRNPATVDSWIVTLRLAGLPE